MLCLYQRYNYDQCLLDNNVSFCNPWVIIWGIKSTDAAQSFVCSTWQDVFSWRTHLMNEKIVNRLLSAL